MSIIYPDYNDDGDSSLRGKFQRAALAGKQYKYPQHENHS